MRFAQIMGPCLCICVGFKVFSKICIMLQCHRICFSGSKQYSLKVPNIQITWECHFSLFKNLPSAVISLSWSFGNASSIHQHFFYTHRAVFHWHVWKYSKAMQKFLKYFIHLIRKKFFHVYALIMFWFLDNNWAH